jgi:hypothetical protein
MSKHRLLISLTLLVSVLAVPGLAVAQESEETTATTVATEGTFLMPAVSVPPAADDVVAAPWTTKFLIPTSLVLAVLAVFVTVVQYFVKVVRNRYKVVE